MWRAACAIEFPYVAYVNTEDVYVRSGPSRDYYPTDKLQKGQEVEVYRHDPGGWLAIRPPAGSFSWVSARHLDFQDEEIAVVNSERTVARVGSAFSDARDVIQVRLEKDEQLALLAPPKGDSPWCKIAPPAGEFRWVFAKYVDRDLPDELAESERDAGPEYARSRRKGDVRLTAGDDSRPESALSGEERAQFSGELERLRELDRIDYELSVMVTEEIGTWKLDELIKRADQAVTTANDSLERGRARVLRSKLARFADIQQRHDALRQSGVPAGTGVAAAAAPSGSLRAADPRYDGIGRLAPVVSKNTGGPQYALVDDKGSVLSFVTPAPGVNLRPYVNQQIGVHGQRSFLFDVQRPHISVQRVAAVAAPTLR
jgi:uncharacterized protein YraI